MVALQKKTEKNLMASTWTEAAKIRRTFKAGRPIKKDRVLTLSRAILEACIALNEIRDKMRDAGLPEEDVQAKLVLASEAGTHDLVYLPTVPTIQGVPELANRLFTSEVKWRPLGLAFWQMDREANSAVGWVQPWLTDERSVRALKKARESISASMPEDGPHKFS